MREIPQEAESRSHQLLLRAGLVRMLMAGAYSYLPLGLMALENIQRIIRQEMNAAGAVETVTDSITLAGAIGRLLDDASLREQRIAAATAVAAAKEGILDAVLAELAPFLDPVSTRQSCAGAALPHHARP